MERRKESQAERERQALILLTLQELAAEVGQMCLLSGYQREYPDDSPIYPDIPREFMTLADCLDRFPIERLVEVGKAEELRALRRICLEMAVKHEMHASMAGARFNILHRDRVGELQHSANSISIALQGEIKALCPGKFDKRLRTHL
ncbi:MAG: hypothetical protein JO067_14950 [Cupriavidus sp.]|nr:hypothetical protein [Cupriavidus sp.]